MTEEQKETRVSVTQEKTGKLCETCGAPATRVYREVYDEFIAGNSRSVVTQERYLCRPHAAKIMRYLPPKDDAYRARAASRVY